MTAHGTADVADLCKRLSMKLSEDEAQGFTHCCDSAPVTFTELRTLLAEAKAEQDALREALRDAREDVAHWAGYASDYFKSKHDLAGDLARIDAALEAKP